MTRRPIGWMIASILLGIYISLKIQGIWFGLQVQGLERKLDEIRPELSNLVLYDQLSLTHAACLEAIDKTQGLGLQAGGLLKSLSQDLPASVTIERLEASPDMGLKVRGSCLPGIRSPEEPLLLWAKKLQKEGLNVQIKHLIPDTQVAGVWRFELKAEKSDG